MPRNRKSNILRYASHAANDLFWFILPLVLPLLLTRYGLSYARAGGILTFYLAISAAGSYLMGRISDGIPRRYMMGFGLWVAAAGLIAAGFAGSFPVFLLFIAVTAVGMSTFHPAMYAHIDETFDEDKGRALSYFEVAGTVAILTMFLVNGALLKSLGSRGVMVITAIPAIVVGSFLLRARFMDSAAGEALPVPDSGAPAAASHAPISLFLFFMLSIILRVMSITAILNFLPTIFTDYFHLPPDRAAWASGLFFAGGIFGSLIASRFARPALSYRILTWGALCVAPVIAGMALHMPLFFHLVLVCLLGFFGSGLLINQNLILVRLASRFGRGEAFGILMGVMTITSSVSPSLFGLAVDNWGFATAILIFSIPVIISAALLAALFNPMSPVISSKAY